ncbi:hypothetical protein CTZ27_35995 [Streptomyces griseocarneus]|nr:hypothetical protein CTZ27_35995 [Streptomyces griseocarneus]
MRLVTALRVVSLITVPAVIGAATLTGCTSEQRKKASRLALEAVGVVGDHPFVRNPDTDLKGVKSPSGGGGQKAADARGAFGGTPGTAHCDKGLLIKQITQDPVEAKAWAKARGIDPNRIAAHIDSLTEVVLLDDTLVKNHDYQGDGRTREYLSVLQKGVAVLNDPYTGPAVKCNCGNPLGEPDRDVDLRTSTYTGVRWESFSETTVTVITPRPKDKGPVQKIPLVDPFQSDKAFDRQVGTDGDQDSATYHWTPPPRATPPARGTKQPSSGTGAPTGAATGTGKATGPATGTATGSATGPATEPTRHITEEPPSSAAGSPAPSTKPVPSGGDTSAPATPGTPRNPTAAGRSGEAVEPPTAKPTRTAATTPPTGGGTQPTKHPPTERPSTERPATQHPPTERPVSRPPVERPVTHPPAEHPTYQPTTHEPTAPHQPTAHEPTAGQQPPPPPRQTNEPRQGNRRGNP